MPQVTRSHNRAIGWNGDGGFSRRISSVGLKRVRPWGERRSPLLRAHGVVFQVVFQDIEQVGGGIEAKLR